MDRCSSADQSRDQPSRSGVVYASGVLVIILGRLLFVCYCWWLIRSAGLLNRRVGDPQSPLPRIRILLWTTGSFSAYTIEGKREADVHDDHTAGTKEIAENTLQPGRLSCTVDGVH